MSEFIRLDDAEQGIYIMGSYSTFKAKITLGRVMVMLHSLPLADVVEVVRCKDCLYNEYGSCEHSMNYPLNTNYCPDFYCAKGLRVRRCRE